MDKGKGKERGKGKGKGKEKEKRLDKGKERIELLLYDSTGEDDYDMQENQIG